MTRALIALLTLFMPGTAAAKPAPVVYLTGDQLQGGAASVFGAEHAQAGVPVNYIYAVPHGERSRMRAEFTLSSVPTAPLCLHVYGRDDDFATVCRVRIALNGRVLAEGPSPFPGDRFAHRRWPLPPGTLKAGANVVEFANLEPEGQLGMPPWFMVGWVAVAPASYRGGPGIERDLHVAIPAARRPFPEPLPAGQAPGFALRGIKGWMWSPEQYLAEIPWLVRGRMNFLMNCYTSMCDIERHPWGSPEVNRWWEDLPSAKMQAYEKVVRACQARGIDFCFSMNPNLSSKRPLDYRSQADLDALWKHYAWMQGLGVTWFNVSLDDISQGIDAAGQAAAVNALLGRLRKKDPRARMVFTPTFYWGDGADPAARAYLEVLARDLHPDVYLFWTGDSVVGQITRAAAESYRRVSGHRILLWDNYPVNDNHPTMHLGPVIRRDADLGAVAEGYMSNPLCRQNEANRLPMLTCADYAYNPGAYDPERSIGQAVLLVERSAAGRRVLADLVEAYPGFILWGKPSTALNPVRERLARLLALPHPRVTAEGYVRRMETLAARMAAAFPRRYRAEQETLRADVRALRERVKARYGP